MALSTEQKEIAKSMWAKGESASHIGDMFGISRAAVCGLAFRGKWYTPNTHAARPKRALGEIKRSHPSRVSFGADNATGERRMRISGPNYGRMVPVNDPELFNCYLQDQSIPVEQRKTIGGLTEKNCHWPGDVSLRKPSPSRYNGRIGGAP